MPSKPGSERSRVRRLPKRAVYDATTIHSIIDASPLCHVGFVQDGQPFVMPTLHGRLGDCIIIHGSRVSRLVLHAASGAPLCLTFTLLDGLVLARSAFHHSVNYRSAVVFGTGRLLETADEQLEALAAVTNHLLPGRWDQTRQPNDRELAATGVVAITIDEASAKIRTGPPVDDDEDLGLPFWAGVIPVTQTYGEPAPANANAESLPLPASSGR